MSLGVSNTNLNVIQLIIGYIKRESLVYIPNGIVDIMILYYGIYDTTFDSDIICCANKTQLMRLLCEHFKIHIRLQRIYSGKINRFECDRFHDLCDNKGPTIVLIENTLEFIFGGYSSISWETSEYSGTFMASKDDEHAFLFQLHPKSVIFHQHHWNEGNRAVFHSQRNIGSHMLAFGGGYDLLITVNGDKNTNNSVSKHTFDMTDEYEIAGDKHFMIKNMEIFTCQPINK